MYLQIVLNKVKKIAAILALETTFICLSDVRLNTGSHNFDNLFSPWYDIIHNSTGNSRGVGILISRTLHYNIVNEYRDINNNILALRIETCGSPMLIISVYGPNNNDKSFYDFLENILSQNKHIPIICAGDWNATYSTERGAHNIDILNMTLPPSFVRSGWLADICEKNSLSDPFRAINYDKREFTYVPRDGGKNRL
jgi:exonuclease III